MSEHSWTEEAYHGLLPVAWKDEQLHWDLLNYIASITEMTTQIVDLVSDTPEGPGWSSIVDVSRAPAEGLEWLAQLAGVTLIIGMTEEQQRAAIYDMAAMRRGTLPALREAIKATLTGTKGVRITERYDPGGMPAWPIFSPAYHMLIQTMSMETPDQQATIDAIISQKPAGITFEFEAISGQTWRTLRDGPPDDRTWRQTKTEFPDWQEAKDYEPPIEEA